MPLNLPELNVLAVNLACAFVIGLVAGITATAFGKAGEALRLFGGIIVAGVVIGVIAWFGL